MMCSNRECARSWGNNSVFDFRIKNWRSILFENVPRLNDPNMANKGFEPANLGRIQEIRTSVFETSEPSSYDDAPDTDPSPPIFDEVISSLPISDEKVSQVSQVSNEKITSTSLPKTPETVNTPFNRPIMLGGTPKEEKTEPGSVFIFDDE